MTDRIEPVIRIPVDPAQVTQLDEDPWRAGGPRTKTTIYVVQEMDLAGQVVETFTVPMGRYVELRMIERDK